MFRIFYITLILLSFGLTACDGKQDTLDSGNAGITLETDGDKLSYGLGLNIGRSVAQQNVPEINLSALLGGISDAVNEHEPQVGQEELQAVFARVRAKEEEKLAALTVENTEKGKAFLSENAKNEGVVSTESGLQYLVINSGEGKAPLAESVVKTHYHGTLIDGTVFDSSIDRGEPAEFAVNQVIPGWTEALQLMKEGDKWRIFLPSQLAYGEMSPGPGIPPNSALIFDIELLQVVN